MEISPQAVRDALETAGVRLLDVRTEAEWQRARIEGATLVTRRLVDEMVGSWDKGTPIVFYCHTGVRSLHAVHFFRSRGFTDVKSMAGGIQAWSLEIDPNVPRY